MAGVAGADTRIGRQPRGGPGLWLWLVLPVGRSAGRRPGIGPGRIPKHAGPRTRHDARRPNHLSTRRPGKPDATRRGLRLCLQLFDAALHRTITRVVCRDLSRADARRAFCVLCGAPHLHRAGAAGLRARCHRAPGLAAEPIRRGGAAHHGLVGQRRDQAAPHAGYVFEPVDRGRVHHHARAGVGADR
ncbi:hypothetical protein D3C87_1441720 [compost metagenome]